MRFKYLLLTISLVVLVTSHAVAMDVYVENSLRLHSIYVKIIYADGTVEGAPVYARQKLMVWTCNDTSNQPPVLVFFYNDREFDRQQIYYFQSRGRLIEYVKYNVVEYGDGEIGVDRITPLN